MKALIALALLSLVLLATERVLAWDNPQSWYNDAHGKDPGGGGLIGTGGKRDYTIQCLHCHIEPQKKIDGVFSPNPAFQSVDGSVGYEPGRRYEITASLIGEYLGTTGCGQYMTHTNNFVATFENAAGEPIGLLESDTGQSSANCPAVAPEPTFGTTITYAECRAVMPHKNVASATEWTFYWTAPPAGTGEVTLYGGFVDGDCRMNSLGDDVKMVTVVLPEGSSSPVIVPPSRAPSPRAPPGSASPRWLIALLALVLTAGAAHAIRLRRAAGVLG